jgi:hypothetical protein
MLYYVKFVSHKSHVIDGLKDRYSPIMQNV